MQLAVLERHLLAGRHDVLEVREKVLVAAHNVEHHIDIGEADLFLEVLGRTKRSGDGPIDLTAAFLALVVLGHRG